MVIDCQRSGNWPARIEHMAMLPMLTPYNARAIWLWVVKFERETVDSGR
jgi:hypothetical protein